VSEELNRRFVQAREKVRAFLAPYGGDIPTGWVEADGTLGESALATHRYPDTVVVRRPDVPESVLAHELVHIAQRTLEQFLGFRLLYVLLAEGLAEFVAKSLYPEHTVKYVVGHKVVSLLVESVPDVIGDLLCINGLSLTPGDVESILTSSRLPPYTRRLLAAESDLIQGSVQRAWELGIEDPTFVTLGEEMRAWKFLLDDLLQIARRALSRCATGRSGGTEPRLSQSPARVGSGPSGSSRGPQRARARPVGSWQDHEKVMRRGAWASRRLSSYCPCLDHWKAICSFDRRTGGSCPVRWCRTRRSVATKLLRQRSRFAGDE
jgi:hypothetical protein